MSGQHAGLPKTTVMVSAIAIAFAGIGTFMILKWTGSRSNIAAIDQQIEEVSVTEGEVRGELTVIEEQLDDLENRTSVLQNGTFAVCNDAPAAISVTYLAATYVSAEGEFVTFNSEEYGRGLWRIEAGERLPLSFNQANATWDGSVLYYSMWLKAGANEYPYAGPWPPNNDECVRWSG